MLRLSATRNELHVGINWPGLKYLHHFLYGKTRLHICTRTHIYIETLVNESGLLNEIFYSEALYKFRPVLSMDFN